MGVLTIVWVFSTRNMCTHIYCFCFVCIVFCIVLCIFILVCFVCTSVRTTATERNSIAVNNNNNNNNNNNTLSLALGMHFKRRRQNIMKTFTRVTGQGMNADTPFEAWNCLITSEILYHIFQYSNQYMLNIKPKLSSERMPN